MSTPHECIWRFEWLEHHDPLGTASEVWVEYQVCVGWISPDQPCKETRQIALPQACSEAAAQYAAGGCQCKSCQAKRAAE